MVQNGANTTFKGNKNYLYNIINNLHIFNELIINLLILLI